MPSAVERQIASLLGSWATEVAARPRFVVAVCAALTVAAALCAGARLGIDTDTIRLFPEDLPARVNHEAFVAHFPDLENALFILVDAENAALARDSAAALVEELRAAPGAFRDAHRPVSDPFFDRHGLLYRSVDELDVFAEHLTRMQPVIGSLAGDPSLATLTTLIDRGLDDMALSDADAAAWVSVLDGFGAATVEVYEEHPLALSWEDVLLSGASIEASTRQIVVADPILDFEQLLPAARALAVVRDAASELGAGVTVRVTGNPALVVDETLGLLWDIGVTGLVCLIVVAFILGAAFQSARLTLAACIVLLAGCVWGGAFASVAVGKLNVISMTAGILFLGLGVDYAIHLGTRYMHHRGQGELHAPAMRASIGDVGTSLVVCSVTTSLGFFAFLPTDYRGVAEFGLVTGVGLFFMLFLTLTLLPALLGSLLPVGPVVRARQGTLSFRAEALGAWLERRHRWVLSCVVLAALVSLALLPRSRFEPNIVAMRDPSTESVQAFEELLADADGASPWLVNSLVSSEAEARHVQAEMKALSVVGRSVALHDFVPAEQDEKLEILADLSMLFDVPRGGAPGPARTAEEQLAALIRLDRRLSALDFATAEARQSALAASVENLQARLGDFTRRAQADSDPAARLGEFEAVLLGSLPAHVDRLLESLEPGEVRAEALPSRLVRRMRAIDGTLRVQSFPSEDLRHPAALTRFVDGVLGVDPKATGVAVNLVAFGRTTQAAFREALIGAALAIFVILFALWRKVSDVLLVMIPLGLAALFTAGSMSALSIPFSFFNVVVIPLMLGAGVDAGVHMVERARTAEGGGAQLVSSTTARAVFYSALTTIVSFGSLGLSAHRGLAGLGTLLTFGMALTVVCNLFVLPALIAWRSAAAPQPLRSSSAPR